MIKINNICKTCDTRLRLNRCDGKEGNFKYCYRQCYTLRGIEESIQPFNELSELKINNKFKDLHIEDYSGKHIGILLGKYDVNKCIKDEYIEKFKDDESFNTEYPLGFIIK